MILDPKVRVECDEPACSEFEELELTASNFARDAYDERDVIRRLERMDWKIDGDITICANHQEEPTDDQPN